MCWQYGIGSGLGLSFVRGENNLSLSRPPEKKKNWGDRETIRERLCWRFWNGGRTARYESTQRIPKLCPCGSITKEFVDEEDTSSAKTTRMTGCISGNHRLWVCNKKLRGSKYGFTSMRNFWESARHLRHRWECWSSVCLNLREFCEVKYKTMCQMKTKDGVSSLFSHR